MKRREKDEQARAREEAAGTRRSSFGLYEGYSEPRYDSWRRSSMHVAVRDGTRLAVDILRPVSGGVVVEEPLPAIWTHTRYHRASVLEDGRIRTTAEHWDPWLLTLIRHGYVVLSVDVRGAGASFGAYQGQYSAEEAHDAYDITEWIAAQPWCDGHVGMYGRSYLGITQYFAASEAPPHLDVIFPEMASFDHYSYAYSGGIFRESSRFNWQLLCGNLDQSVPTVWRGEYQGPVAPVDADPQGALRGEALREHRRNRDWFQMLEPLVYRDSLDAASGEPIHQSRSAATRREAIEASGIPIYHLAGWFDMFPRDTLLWFRNLTNPQKVVIGPWFHVDSAGLDLAAEHLRWYDHWLKGIDTHVMREDPIHYWTIDAPAGEEWRSSAAWPLPNEQCVAFYLAPGPSGSTCSVNDGVLDRHPPAGEGADRYWVDYTATSGMNNRWANANGGPTGYPDTAANDAKGLTYTTPPLDGATEVTGHPVLHLWISSTAEDGDFYAYLEDVHSDGTSRYVTEGALRASHRALAEPPWDNLGLPYHRGCEGDVEPLRDEPVELVFDLHPTSKLFAAGHRMRLTVTGADIDNDRALVHSPPPTVTVYRDRERPSRLILPIIPRR